MLVKPNQPQIEELLCFLEEYAAFFEQYARREEEKLAALKSNKLDRIEKTLANEQAVVMEMGNLEKRRAALLEAAGLEGKTFREIADLLPGEESGRCTAAQERMEAAIASVREGNRQCMEVAREKMAILAKVLPESEQPAQTYSPYQKKAPGAGKDPLFQSKI